ncbi:MAG: F0F1 ATP synthase subunit delta [Propionibacteriaceae bacterium]|jgi:F-type H+-transporting ATPase subunit delta|nr:F0F1 ATP synthase subunit delta [Propionibacteriaceae bacterium]
MTDADSTARVGVTQDLITVARALQDYPGLTRALADPAASSVGRVQLIDQVFSGLSDQAREVVHQVTTRSWKSTTQLTQWIEQAAIRAAWQWAQHEATVEQAIDEVFSFGQLMRRDHELRAAVTDPNKPVSARQDLVRRLLTPVFTAPATQICLAAVAARRGTIDDSIAAFVGLGVDLVGGRLAVVTVAKPLPSDQKTRLNQALHAKLGGKLVIQEVVDPSVMGGVRVECGAEVIDDTVTSRLRQAQRDFS